MAIDPMTLAAASGAVSSLTSLGQGHFDRKNQRRNVDATIAGNRELSEYAYKMDLDQWNRQNEYNTPSAQMSRFKDAGLNPNLVYGQGTPGNALSSPDYKPPKEEYNYMAQQMPDLGGMINTYQDMQLRQAQVDNVKANTDQTIAQTANEFITGDLKLHELEHLRPYQAGILSNQAIASNQLPRQAEVETSRKQVEEYQKSIEARLTQMRFEYERDTGLSPNDAAWLRIAVKALPSMGIPESIIRKSLGNKLWNQLMNPKQY